MNRRAFLAALPALPAAAIAVARAKPPMIEGYVQEWPMTVEQGPLTFTEYADPTRWDDDHFFDAANYLRHLAGHYDGIPFFTDEPR